MPTHVRYPQGHTLLRHLQRDFPVATHGQGVYLFDASGNQILDAAGGALVVSCGHGVSEITTAIAQQMQRLSYVNGTQFTSEAMERASTRLAALASPLGLDRVALLGSGSEAIEAAVKFARQLWVERGEPQRATFIARTPGYHGNTFYALSASGRPHYKTYFAPLLSRVATVSAAYGYRCPVDYNTQGAQYYAEELEAALLKEGPSTVAGFLVEPVSGSSTGAWAPPPGYFEAISAVCRKHGVLIIADEVLCGAGRTGKFFASEHFGLKPDIAVLGKGLGSGYVPVSALLVRGADADTMARGTGYFLHAQTYMQAPVLAACVNAVLDYFEKHRLVEAAATVGSYLLAQLQARLAPLPGVGSVTGLGLLAGVEFVADKGSKQPFDRSAKMVEGLVTAAYRRGITLWPNVGHAGGTHGDLVVLGPPLVLTRKQADAIVDAMESAIQETF